MPILKQICLATSKSPTMVGKPATADSATRLEEIRLNRQSLLQSCPEDQWPLKINEQSCPHPILVSRKHLSQLEELHEALNLAITNIVERWWSDEEADFPQRMPLEPYEADVLQWLDCEEDTSCPYKGNQGSWRPDFLIELTEAGSDEEPEERFRICEINARFPWNGFCLTAFGQEALDATKPESIGLVSASKSITILSEMLMLFCWEFPLHLLKGKEYGIDIHLLTAFLKGGAGVTPRIITPADLRLVPDPESSTGSGLYCVADHRPTSWEKNAYMRRSLGEENKDGLEPIYQIGLELHQSELQALPVDILPHLGMNCFNKLRTIFLVHDKRMLGIVLQELDALVSKHHVLTERQSAILRNGIVETIIPGSPELERFNQSCGGDPSFKGGFILKPIRGGKGEGILFGTDLTADEWLSKVEKLRNPTLVSGEDTYVIQRLVKQPDYELLLREEDGVQHSPLVGTYLSIHGKFIGLGVWRSSTERVCAISHGGAWMCSVTPANPDPLDNLKRKREESEGSREA